MYQKKCPSYLIEGHFKYNKKYYDNEKRLNEEMIKSFSTLCKY